MPDNDRTQPASPNSDATHGSEDQLDRPGMTNGVPDQADGEKAKGLPHDERQQTENAGSEPGNKPDGSSGS